MSGVSIVSTPCCGRRTDDCCANEPWPIIKYTVSLSRADNYYTLRFVLPGILITMLSFAVFFVVPEACDALAYSVTVVLANEVTKITIFHMVPVCGEVLWTDIFGITNTIFCVVSLFESLAQVILSHNSTEYLLPEWAMLFFFTPLLRTAKALSARLQRRCSKAATGAERQRTKSVDMRRSASEPPKVRRSFTPLMSPGSLTRAAHCWRCAPLVPHSCSHST